MLQSYLKLSILLWVTVGCYGYLRVCYFTNWSQYSKVKFRASQIDPFMCTHIIYAFAKLTGTDIQDIEWNEQTIQANVMKLKETNPNLKVLLAIGGWNADNTQYVNLVANTASMNTFSTNAITYLRARGFDGLDLDWEYPGNVERKSSAQDKFRFTTWIQTLRAAFVNEAARTGNARLLLTAAAAADAGKASEYYEISKLGQYLDYVMMMSYDFHGGWDANTLGTQHHSALFPETDSAVTGWLARGFPASKLVMGMGTYARGYKLSSRPTGTGLGIKPSTAQFIIPYYDVCAKLNAGHTLVQLPNERAVAAVGQANGVWEWIGFDNAQTFRTKASYIISKGLAGAMAWSIDQDDAGNACGGGNYPLVRVLKEMLPDDIRISPTPLTDVTTPRNIPYTPYPTLRPPPVNSNCNMVWPKPPRCYSRSESVPYDDSKYYWVCTSERIAIECKCLLGRFYNPCKQKCDYRSLKPTCPIAV